METTYQHYKIFISSPGDVMKERDIADKVITKVNNTIGESLRMHLEVVRWEKLPSDVPKESIQEMINKKVHDCQFFLLILNKRYGTKEEGQAISNTEREINAIFESPIRKRILAYFRTLENNQDKGLQEQEVIELKKRLVKERNVFYKEYSDENEFKELLVHEIYRMLLNMHLSPYKVEKLKTFWRFGKADDTIIPKTLIIYPPVPRKWMASDDDDHFWHRRLQPNLFYEDYKAINKINKTLSLVGFKSFKVLTNFTYNSTSAEYKNANLIWVCLPRQAKAIKILDTSYEQKRFTIEPRTDKELSMFKWKSKNDAEILIKSPLGTYLEIQRPKVDKNTEWETNLGQIIAKDYAIIARFIRPIPENKYIDEKIKEYFIAGIRGLGTWGAASFIDKSFLNFDFKSNEEIQMLLEVTYENGAIYSVEDVSDKDQAYFDKECSSEHIKGVINEFRGN